MACAEVGPKWVQSESVDQIPAEASQEYRILVACMSKTPCSYHTAALSPKYVLPRATRRLGSALVASRYVRKEKYPGAQLHRDAMATERLRLVGARR
jgi:hypothetical protein